MKPITPKFISWVSLVTVVAMTFSLGWSASHCATFEAGKALLATQANLHAHAGHHGQGQQSQDHKKHSEHSKSSDHCQYCQAATGDESIPVALPLPRPDWVQVFVACNLTAQQSFVDLHCPPRGPPSA